MAGRALSLAKDFPLYRNALGEGIKADGETDDTDAIQALFDDAEEGETIAFPPRVMKISDAIEVTKCVTIQGAGCFPAYASLNDANVMGVPALTQRMFGTVFEQHGAGKDAFKCTGSGKSLVAKDFGMKFAEAIQHTDTGHGINAAPSATFSDGSDHGLMYPKFDRIFCFGHDGDHYALRTVNSIFGTIGQLFSWGGGGLSMTVDSYAGNYGNYTISDLQIALYCNGTAHAAHFDARVGPSTVVGLNNLITLIRPGLIFLDETGRFTETTAPDTDTQYGIWFGDNMEDISILMLDVEQTDVKMKLPSHHRWLNSSGRFGDSIEKTNLISKPINGSLYQYSDNTFKGIAHAASISAGSAAGTGAPAPSNTGLMAGAFAGSLTCGTGTGATAGALVHVTLPSWSTAFSAYATPLNAATAALGLYIANKTATGYDICCANAPDSSQAVDTYAIDYGITFAG